MLTKMRDYFGFTTLPFGRGLTPGQLFSSASHNEAVARITYAIQTRALAVVAGEVGAGKTVAARAAISALDGSRHHPIYLPNPTIGARGIHTAVVAALGGIPRFHHATLIPQAADALAAEVAERGRTPILVIDEAHLLGHDQLEAIRMLTNSELDSASPLACLLLGQPRLRHNMKLAVLAALDQRITIRYTMNPMTAAETAEYLRHHTKLALLTELPGGAARIAGQALVGVATFSRHDQTGRPAPGPGRAARTSGRCAEGDRRPVGAVPAARPGRRGGPPGRGVPQGPTGRGTRRDDPAGLWDGSAAVVSVLLGG